MDGGLLCDRPTPHLLDLCMGAKIDHMPQPDFLIELPKVRGREHL